MITVLNYIIEANLGLLLVLAFYKLLLHRETHFRFLRMFLLTGIFTSLLFPLIHIPGGQAASGFSISQVIPTYWLPEVVVGGGEAVSETHKASFNFWQYATVIYYTGVVCICLVVLFQLTQLFRIIRRSATYRLNRLRIAESTENKPTFSFFNFIFIGQADQLASGEKQQIIQHESVHVSQGHSFDILLINLLKMFFWFNPFINTYKKIFIQLHEFEADARAVENSDVNKYCSLLARVALQSADFTLANYFNNSLTVKRIEMMRALKTKIKPWKLIALMTVVPGIFFLIACQDQLEDIKTITESSVIVIDVPEVVQKRMDELKKDNPEKKYLLIEPTGSGQLKLEELTSDKGKIDPSWVSSVMVLKDIQSGKGDPKRSFIIVEYNEQTKQLSEASKTGDVFTVVQVQPEFVGGYDAMMSFFRSNMRYPDDARKQGVEGIVYVSFIVEKDGTISEEKVIRGISPACDAEALRVMQSSPAWNPGKQDGQVVRVRFVMPIKFKLG